MTYSPLSPLPDDISDDTPRRSRVGRVILWLVVVSLGALLLPLYLLGATIDEQNARLQDDIGTQRARLDTGPPASRDEQGLQATLSAALGHLSALQPASASLKSNRIDWPGVAASLSNYHDDYMVVLGLTQTERLLTLQGRAWNEQTVLDYARRLEESGYFAAVTVQSLSGNVAATDPPARGTPTPVPATPSRLRYVEFVLTAEFKAAEP